MMRPQLSYRARKALCQKLTASRPSNQLEKIADTEFDVLVVLDACRADVLRATADWPIETAVSPASCTPEWLGTAFDAGTFDGARIVSGNPQYEKADVELDGVELQRCWESDWDDSLQTTLPEPILDRATDAAGPDSPPVIAHLQQPHWPYVAKVGDAWRLAYENTGPWDGDGLPEEITSVQVAMARGQIDRSEAYAAYRASVASVWETVLDYVQQWIEEGYTTVVTADHGETFGRVRDFTLCEHACHCHIGPLITVPWVEFAPVDTREATADDVDARLAALGYAD